uniref:Uncharacterized protein n=1 Tax=Cucumis melo TaxID=3656 RepID=A0A9I9E2Z4_CUCME
MLSIGFAGLLATGFADLEEYILDGRRSSCFGYSYK